MCFLLNNLSLLLSVVSLSPALSSLYLSYLPLSLFLDCSSISLFFGSSFVSLSWQFLHLSIFQFFLCLSISPVPLSLFIIPPFYLYFSYSCKRVSYGFYSSQGTGEIKQLYLLLNMMSFLEWSFFFSPSEDTQDVYISSRGPENALTILFPLLWAEPNTFPILFLIWGDRKAF